LKIEDDAVAVSSQSIKIQAQPGALIFKDSWSFDLKARACASCGYVESYIARPDDLETFAGIVARRDRNVKM
jgi:hypothetical protein